MKDPYMAESTERAGARSNPWSGSCTEYQRECSIERLRAGLAVATQPPGQPPLSPINKGRPRKRSSGSLHIDCSDLQPPYIYEPHLGNSMDHYGDVIRKYNRILDLKPSKVLNPPYRCMGLYFLLASHLSCLGFCQPASSQQRSLQTRVAGQLCMASAANPHHPYS
jgi:hypothetical protein